MSENASMSDADSSYNEVMREVAEKEFFRS
jgi:hypothetical protein